MTQAKLAPDGRTRHWLVDLGLGSASALAALTIAHAGMPEPAAHTARPTLPTIRFTSAPAPQQEPPALIAFIDPVPGRVIVSPFGLRQLPWEEGGRLHAGVDIQAAAKQAVLAAADGVVTAAGYDLGYGRYVALRHAEGLTSLYAHMGKVEPGLHAGVALKAGQPVGVVGSSGSSTGPHLHFEIRDRKGHPLNPALFLGRRFAEADDLPLSQAQRFGRRVRLAQVSMIPASKRALMEDRKARDAAEDALKAVEKDLKRSARSAATAGVPAAATEGEGLQELTTGPDGRPRATLSL